MLNPGIWREGQQANCIHWKKKSVYKWTYTVQDYVDQGTAVVKIQILKKGKNPINLSLRIMDCCQCSLSSCGVSDVLMVSSSQGSRSCWFSRRGKRLRLWLTVIPWYTEYLSGINLLSLELLISQTGETSVFPSLAVVWSDPHRVLLTIDQIGLSSVQSTSYSRQQPVSSNPYPMFYPSVPACPLLPHWLPASPWTGQENCFPTRSALSLKDAPSRPPV